MNTYTLNVVVLMVLCALAGAALTGVAVAILRRQGLRKLAASLETQLSTEINDTTPSEQPAVAPEMALAMSFLAGLGINPQAESETAVAETTEPAFAEVLDNQASWDLETFGPGLRTNGFLNHIRKELAEIEADPTDVEEWVDVMIIAAGGAMRLGTTGDQLVVAYTDKMRKNIARVWPDWRDYSQDEPIEHVRDSAAVTS